MEREGDAAEDEGPVANGLACPSDRQETRHDTGDAHGPHDELPLARPLTRHDGRKRGVSAP